MEPIGKSDYRIELINSLPAWQRLAGSWNDLLASSRADTVFLRWEWLYSWAECFLGKSRELFIAAVYQEDQLIGIAPWYLHQVVVNGISVRQIEFLGSPESGSDYLNVIIRSGKEREVTNVLYQFLFDQARSHWDCLELHDIPSDSLFLLYLQERIDREGKYAEIRKSSYCPVAILPKNGDSMPSAVSSGRKARFRLDMNRLKKKGELRHVVVSGIALDSGFDEFFSFYNEKTGFDGKHLHALLKKAASRSDGQDLFQIDFLNLGERTLAALVHIRYNNELLMYLMAVDKAYEPKVSSGNLLVGLAIKQACERGIDRYDFLKGTEQYKFSWADCGRTSVSFFLGQKKVKPILLNTVRLAKYMAKIILR